MKKASFDIFMMTECKFYEFVSLHFTDVKVIKMV